jgi:hypothetical protein
MNRQHGVAVYNSLKTGWKLLVQSVGGLDALAAATRIGRSQASDYGNLASDKFPPIDVVLDAETIAGRPLVTQALAALAGYSLMPVPPSSDGDLAVELSQIGQAVATLFGDASQALTHPALTEAERLRLMRDLAEVTRVVACARHLLSQRKSHETEK